MVIFDDKKNANSFLDAFSKLIRNVASNKKKKMAIHHYKFFDICKYSKLNHLVYFIHSTIL